MILEDHSFPLLTAQQGVLSAEQQRPSADVSILADQVLPKSGMQNMDLLPIVLHVALNSFLLLRENVGFL